MVSTFRRLVRAAGLGTLGGVVVWLAVVGAAVATDAPELDVPAGWGGRS